MLDIDHGTYPFVTSSNTVAGRRRPAPAWGRARSRLRARHHQGLHHPRRQRAVPDRAGHEIGELLGERGREFGTVTGRKRRCGWFDAVLVRQAVKTNGIDGIALTKLDVLDGFEEIKVCTGYGSTASEIDYLPAQPAARRGRAGLRDDRGLGRIHAGRAPGPNCRRRR
jgi:adenylosuccinate synthase